MIAAATIQELVASSPFETIRNAIVAELKRLLKGVTVVAHPGKLDMNDLLAKAIVTAPGVALGWSRVRGIRAIDGGTYEAPIDWTAYVVTEDFVDQKVSPPKRVAREIVAMAIGTRILQIVEDADAQFWGLTGLAAPSADAPPELRPLLTMKSADNATSVYTITWSQGPILQGTSPFEGEPIGVAAVPDGMEFDLPDEVPPEILALLGREKADAPPQEDDADDEAA